MQTLSKAKLTPEEVQRRKEMKKQELEEERARKKEQKEVEKAQRKEERNKVGAAGCFLRKFCFLSFVNPM